MKTKILVDFQICISAPLSFNQVYLDSTVKLSNKATQPGKLRVKVYFNPLMMEANII